jgi:hypothetical protein
LQLCCMKKLTLIAAFSFFLAAGAMAQNGVTPTQPAAPSTPATPAQVQRQDNQNAVKTDAQKIQDDKTLRKTSHATAKAAKKNIHAERKDMHKDAKTAKESGVKHPIQKAEKVN